MKKLLIVSPFVYYPGVPHGGGALCWGQLRELASLFEIHFICFYRDQAEIDTSSNHLNTYCKTVEYVHLPINQLRVATAKLKLITKLVPIDATLYGSKEMAEKLKVVSKRIQPDAVLTQFPQMAQYVEHLSDLHAVHDVQDAFSVSAYRRYKSSTGVDKMVQLLNWLGWVNYESKYYRQFKALFTLTNQDQIGLKIFNPGINANVSHAAVSLASVKWQWSAHKTIGFIGSYSHLPNLEALLYLLNEVMPYVLQILPEVRFQIAGKGVPENVVIKYSSKSVQFLGLVPSSEEFIASCGVFAVPLLSGGGVKIKTLEALACGCPVVATSIGAEETGAIHQEHLSISDEPRIFAELLIKSLTDQSYAEHLSHNAIALIEKHFSWKAKAQSMNQVLNIE